jgi:hypothetical protein
MVDIQTVSIVVVSASVVIAAIYYILQIRHQKRTRDTDLVIRLYSYITSDEWEKAYMKMLSVEYYDYNDFAEKYGGWVSENPVSIAADKACAFYEQLRYLVRKKTHKYRHGI